VTDYVLISEPPHRTWSVIFPFISSHCWWQCGTTFSCVFPWKMDQFRRNFADGWGQKSDLHKWSLERAKNQYFSSVVQRIILVTSPPNLARTCEFWNLLSQERFLHHWAPQCIISISRTHQPCQTASAAIWQTVLNWSLIHALPANSTEVKNPGKWLRIHKSSHRLEWRQWASANHHTLIYVQSFNFRSVVPQISFDKKALHTITNQAIHPPTQLAQFHTA